jgi:fatty-acyl-CoA synthase
VNLGHIIRRARKRYPEAVAFSDRTSQHRLDSVVDRAERFANSLDALGLPRRAPIGVLSENRVEYPEVDLGLALAGRVRVGLNARLHRDDFAYALNDCDARALVHSAAFAGDAQALSESLGIQAISLDDPEFDELDYHRLIDRSSPTAVARDVAPEDVAWISYTSGTTGRPKGVVLSHRAIREVTFNLLLELGPLVPDTRLVLAQPLSHGAGYFVLPQLASGGNVHVMSHFDAEEALWAAEWPGANTLKVVPAMFPALLEAAEASPGHARYDTIIYGAAPMPGPVLDRAIDQFGQVFVQVYGQSEAPMTLSCLHKQDHVRTGDRRRSAGRPWRSVEIVVRDPSGDPAPIGEIGEVTIRGQHHMTGYHGLPDATAEVLRDGWVWTKDIGRFDDADFLYLLGRRDEMINSGGFNVSPREVEHVLQGHPDVEESFVIGLPSARWGEEISALVRVREGARVTSADIIAFARPRLTFRTPRRLVITDTVPRNPYGKIDRDGAISLLSSSDSQAPHLAVPDQAPLTQIQPQ